jgi:uncharacterized membrane protein
MQPTQTNLEQHAKAASRGALAGPGFLTGLALGGFFDGIVLHQILQWHHLLSGIKAAPLADLRLQILADGLFHAVMYAIGAVGVAMLWTRRARLAQPRAGRHLASWVLAGFGGWHVIDAVLSHWLIGLHRIRQDAAQPLLWDLGWLAVFGLLPLVLAWRIGTRNGREPPDTGASGTGRGSMGTQLGAWALALLTVSAGAWGSRPPPDDGQALVVFRPGMAPAQAFDALGAADARVLWVDPTAGVWAVQGLASGARSALYRDGALFVAGGLTLAGCAAWSTAPL